MKRINFIGVCRAEKGARLLYFGSLARCSWEKFHRVPSQMKGARLLYFGVLIVEIENINVNKKQVPNIALGLLTLGVIYG